MSALDLLVRGVKAKKYGRPFYSKMDEALLNLPRQKGTVDEFMRELEKQFEAERVRTSDEEYLVIYPAAYWQWQRAIEAKIKEKNYVS